MQNELVSIIVPVYNVREYVAACLTSIMEQTYKNIEVIVVLDCPTDGSDEICKEFAGQDSRIKLVEFSENRGLVAGRKMGVQVASAERIMFVDADDYIESDMVWRFMECAGDYDLVVGNHKNLVGDTLYEYHAKMQKKGGYRTNDEMRFFLSRVLTYPDCETWEVGLWESVWAKLYKRKLLIQAQKNISEEIYFFEDYVLVYPYALLCESILVTDITGYVWRVRAESMCRSLHKDYLYQLHMCYDLLSTVFSKHPMSESLQQQLEDFMKDSLIQAGSLLGFSIEKQIKTFIFPFINLLSDKRIVLYASGKVGKEYYYQIQKQKFCIVDKWVSKSWERERASGLPVSPVSDILKDTYDYVVIAVERENMAEEIRRELIGLGVKKEKILWRKPIYTINL